MNINSYKVILKSLKTGKEIPYVINASANTPIGEIMNWKINQWDQIWEIKEIIREVR